MLKPILAARVTKQVQQQLAAYVSSRRFNVGDRLPSLREFTEALGVSRPSVREGLRALEALGMVEIRHGSGIYVASGMPPMMSDTALVDSSARGTRVARELLDVRLALEPEVSAIAAIRATASDLEKLTKHVDDFRHNLGKVANPDSDIAFHIDLCRATHNNAFTAIMGWIGQFYAKGAKPPEAKDVDDHARILDAVKKRDPQLARAEMTAHLKWIGQILDKHAADDQPKRARRRL